MNFIILGILVKENLYKTNYLDIHNWQSDGQILFQHVLTYFEVLKSNDFKPYWGVKNCWFDWQEDFDVRLEVTDKW